MGIGVGDLPEDLLVGVLRRLPPRSLAVSRCACRAWREAVDARGLLRADLLPRSVRGLFINYTTLDCPEFFSRPTMGPAIWGDLEFDGNGFWDLKGHCNGLLLCTATCPRDDSADDPKTTVHKHDLVVNPATRRWARLPQRPVSRMEEAVHQVACLVFDPTLSPHFEVFLIPVLPIDEGSSSHDPHMLQSEWPPLSYELQVFSSAKGRWEEKHFVREGRPAGVFGDMKGTYRCGDKQAVYWRRALYLHCKCESVEYVMRISMLNGKYKIGPMPLFEDFKSYARLSLGRSEKGVYCALGYDWHGLQIFLLDESCGQMGWVLKHHVDLLSFSRKLMHAREDYDQQIRGPWILQDINDYKYPIGNDRKVVCEEKFQWSSDDDDDVINTEDMVEGHYTGYIFFLQFHPYKEVIYLNASLRRGLAYHWNTSKFQDLGNIFPKDYEMAGHVAEIETSFVYTPCWMEDFPEITWEDHAKD